MATTQSSGGIPYVDQQGKQRQAFGKKSSNAKAAPAEKKGFFSMFSGSKKSSKLPKKQQPIRKASSPVMQQAPPPVIPTIPRHELAPPQQQPVAQPPQAPAMLEQAPVVHTIQAPVHPPAPAAAPVAQMEYHSAAAIEAEMQANMRLVQTEMLDGSVQELPLCVAQQLKDLGLCKMIDAFPHFPVSNNEPPAAPEVEVQLIPGYYPQRAPPKGVPMSTSAPNNNNGQTQQRPQTTMSMPQGTMSMPQQQHRQLMAPPVQDEMVELEMPDGTVVMIPQSEARRLGAIPAEQQMQRPPQPKPMPMSQQFPQMQQMGGGMQMGGVIEIGPPQILSGPPIQMGTMQQAIQGYGMQHHQQGGMRIIQQQQPQMQMQQHSRMQTIVINKQPQQQQEPIVQLIMPNGEVKMLPKSQALQIANQIKSQQAQQRTQSLSMPQPVQHQMQQAVGPRSMSMLMPQEQQFQGHQQPPFEQQQQQQAYDPYQQNDFLQPYQGADTGAQYQTQDFGGYPQQGGFDNNQQWGGGMEFGGGMDM